MPPRARRNGHVKKAAAKSKNTKAAAAQPNQNGQDDEDENNSDHEEKKEDKNSGSSSESRAKKRLKEVITAVSQVNPTNLRSLLARCMLVGNKEFDTANSPLMCKFAHLMYPGRLNKPCIAVVKFCITFLVPHDEVGDIKNWAQKLITPPGNSKNTTFEAYILNSIKRQQRFSNRTAAMCLELAHIFFANQTIAQADRVSLHNIMPDLHTKRDDELEMLASLLYASTTTTIRSFNYFFNDDGTRRPWAESQAALDLHRGLIDEQESTSESLRSSGQEFYDMEMETQVRLTFMFLYMALAPANAMDILTAWVNSNDPKISHLLSNNAQGFFRYLVGFHISNPVVAAQPQWWTTPAHKTAICACISSCEAAPAAKVAALTKALLAHMSPMSTAGEDDGADGDDGEPAEGQLDAEDEAMQLPT